AAAAARGGHGWWGNARANATRPDVLRPRRGPAGGLHRRGAALATASALAGGKPGAAAPREALVRASRGGRWRARARPPSAAARLPRLDRAPRTSGRRARGGARDGAARARLGAARARD